MRKTKKHGTLWWYILFVMALVLYGGIVYGMYMTFARSERITVLYNPHAVFSQVDVNQMTYSEYREWKLQSFLLFVFYMSIIVLLGLLGYCFVYNDDRVPCVWVNTPLQPLYLIIFVSGCLSLVLVDYLTRARLRGDLPLSSIKFKIVFGLLSVIMFPAILFGIVIGFFIMASVARTPVF